MLIGFKTQLQPNNKQRSLFLQHSGTARHAWNICLSGIKSILEHNKTHPDNKLKLPSSVDLHKWLVAVIKRDYPWYYEVSKCAPQQAIRHLSNSVSDFFKKKKISGKTVGFPSYKKRGRKDSFYLDGSIKTDNFAIQLPRIGWVRTYERLPQGITPKNVTVSRKADKWFVSFKVEIPEEITTKTRKVVGIDLGVKNLATLSTGEVIEGVKSYRKYEKKLARLQYLARKKEKKSKNRAKANLVIAKLHLKVANMRNNELHKLTSYLAKNHSKIVIEDLNVSGMMQNHKLAKAIQDMGFYEFRRQLDYKSKLYGSEVVTVNRFYPSSKTCSNCDVVKKELELGERIFKCEACGFEIDRDLNASINLEKAGSSSV